MTKPPKKGIRAASEKLKSVKSDGESETLQTNKGLGRGFEGSELTALLTECALNPTGRSFELIAKDWNITRQALYDIRKQNADTIERIKADFYEQHEGRVMEALISSATGPYIKSSLGEGQAAPNPKSIELFLNLRGSSKAPGDSDPLRIYDSYWPLRKQAEFIFSGDPFGHLTTNFLISGIAFGKTIALCEKALILARRNRKRIGMIVAPTYKMLEHPIIEYLLVRLNELGIKYQHRKANGELILWGDTTILLRSADNPDNLRGPTLAWVCGDELRNWTKAAYDICLGRIRDPQARDKQFAGTSTPYGFNWIYDLVSGEGMEKREAKTQVIYAKTSDNVFLPGDFIDHVRNTYDKDFAEQELEGKFVHVGKGLIFHAFDRSIHIKEVAYDPSLPLWICQDFNVDPMATVLCQPHRIESGLIEVHVFKELSVRGSAQDTIQVLQEMGFGPNTGKETFVYPDATGWNRSAASSRSPVAQFQEAGYLIVTPRTNPLIRDRYAAVNGKLKNANGIATLFIHPSCTSLRNDFEREVYQEGAPVREKGRDGAAKRGHHSDALGYCIHNEFAIESGLLPARLV